MASCADLHRRIKSSWRNHISSRGAAELGPQPDPQKHHLFYTTKENEIQGASGLHECACVCVYRWGIEWGDMGQETEEGNHRRTTSEGHCVSVKPFSP